MFQGVKISLQFVLLVTSKTGTGIREMFQCFERIGAADGMEATHSFNYYSYNMWRLVTHSQLRL